MTWDDVTTSDFAADEPCPVERPTYLVEESDIYIGEIPFRVYFTEQSTSTASWQDAHTFECYTADYSSGWYLHGRCQVKVAAGSGGQIRLRNETDGNNGTAQTGISNTSYATSDDLSVQIDAVAHSLVQFKVQIQGDGSNLMYVHNGVAAGRTYMTFWFESTA